MKIRLQVSAEKTEEVRNFLAERNIEISEDSEFILIEKGVYISHLKVRNPETDERIHISVDDIVTIESYGHIVEVHTEKELYQISERLYQLINILDPEKFLRVSNSVIISKSKVKRINPSFSMKFVLVMTNGDKIDVTRSYYASFRESFNI